MPTLGGHHLTALACFTFLSSCDNQAGSQRFRSMHVGDAPIDGVACASMTRHLHDSALPGLVKVFSSLIAQTVT